MRKDLFFILFLVFFSVLNPHKGFSEYYPFPEGFSMSTMGSILKKDGYTGRQPWISSAYTDDTTSLNVALYNIWYHSTILKAHEHRLMHTGLGLRFSWEKYLNLKAALSRFNAFSMYTEDRAYLSLSTRMIPFLRPGIQVSGSMYNLDIKGYDTRYSADIGFSAVVLLRSTALFVEVNSIPLKGRDIKNQVPELRAGFSVSGNLLGSQGAAVVVDHIKDKPHISISAGERYYISKYIALCAGFNTNPMMLSFGFEVVPQGNAYGMSLVHLSRLGWSQGLSVEFCR